MEKFTAADGVSRLVVASAMDIEEHVMNQGCRGLLMLFILCNLIFLLLARIFPEQTGEIVRGLFCQWVHFCR